MSHIWKLKLECCWHRFLLVMCNNLMAAISHVSLYDFDLSTGDLPKELHVPQISSCYILCYNGISIVPLRLKQFLNSHFPSFAMMRLFFYSSHNAKMFVKIFVLIGHEQLHFSKRLVGYDCHEVVLWYWCFGYYKSNSQSSTISFHFFYIHLMFDNFY